MDKVIGLMLLLVLAGCSKDIPSHELKKAEIFCKDHEDVYALNTMPLILTRVVCNDGASAGIK